MENQKATSERKSKKPAKKSPIKIRYRELSDGRRSIMLDTYVNGKRSYEFLGLYLLPESDAKAIAQNAKTQRKAERMLAERLKEWRRLEKIEKAASVSIPVAKLPGERLLLAWLDEYHDIQKNRGVVALSRIPTLKDIVRDAAPEIRLCDIDLPFCGEFIVRLRQRKNSRTGELLSSKTTFNILGELKTALNTAVRLGYIRENPLMKIPPHEKIKPKEKKRDFLTIPEIKSMAASPCGCPLVKQAYMFACNCGLRLGDLLALRWDDISTAGGHSSIRIRMQKTKRPIVLPLGRQAVKWLPRRSGADGLDKVFAGLTKFRISRFLQPWADAAGINKKITFHTSRHSFATTLLTIGVDLYTASKLLGHTSIRHTQRYAQIVNSVKEDAVSAIDSAFPLPSNTNLSNQ